MKKLGDLLHNKNNQNFSTIDELKNYKKRQSLGIYKNQNLFNFFEVIEQWEELVGFMLAQNSSPLNYKFKTLTIVTKHSIFSQELKFLELELIKKLKSQFPDMLRDLEKIKLVTSEAFFTKQLDKKKHSKQIKKIHPFDPNFRKVKEEAQETFQDIKDNELREYFEKIFIEKKLGAKLDN